MGDAEQLDSTYHFIMEFFVKSGRAPHYTEIGRELATSPEEGKRLLHDLMKGTRLPIWFYPGTDAIASFSPFNNSPTKFRVTVEAEQKWFAQ